MKCNNCGSKNNDGAKFCNECGAGLNEDKKDKIIDVEIVEEKDKVIPVAGEKNIKTSGNGKRLRIGVMAGLIIICIIGLGTLGYLNTYVYNPEKIFNEFSEDSNSAISKYYKLPESKKVQVDQYIKDELEKDYAEITNNMQVTIDRYKDVSSLKDYLQTMRNKAYSRDIYNAGEEKINKAGGILNLEDYVLSDISKNYSNITSDSEYYDNAKKKLQEIKVESDKRFKAKYGIDPPSDKKEVKKEGVRIGMTQDEVLNSTWGKPNKINKTTSKYGTSEQWVYGGNNYLYFENGILTTIQN
jgi:hypothetical protein